MGYNEPCVISQQPIITWNIIGLVFLLQWHQNEFDGISVKSPTWWLFTEPLIRVQIKKNIKALRHWPLWGEFTSDRWIPRTKGPLMRKTFPFDDVIIMMSHGITRGLKESNFFIP